MEELDSSKPHLKKDELAIRAIMGRIKKLEDRLRVDCPTLDRTSSTRMARV